MLDLFYGLEPDLALHATVLAGGCATFFLILLWRSCPSCTWHEWVSELLRRDDKGDAPDE